MSPFICNRHFPDKFDSKQLFSETIHKTTLEITHSHPSYIKTCTIINGLFFSNNVFSSQSDLSDLKHKILEMRDYIKKCLNCIQPRDEKKEAANKYLAEEREHDQKCIGYIEAKFDELMLLERLKLKKETPVTSSKDFFRCFKHH